MGGNCLKEKGKQGEEWGKGKTKQNKKKIKDEMETKPCKVGRG